MHLISPGGPTLGTRKNDVQGTQPLSVRNDRMSLVLVRAPFLGDLPPPAGPTLMAKHSFFRKATERPKA